MVEEIVEEERKIATSGDHDAMIRVFTMERKSLHGAYSTGNE